MSKLMSFSECDFVDLCKWVDDATEWLERGGRTTDGAWAAASRDPARIGGVVFRATATPPLQLSLPRRVVAEPPAVPETIADAVRDLLWAIGSGYSPPRVSAASSSRDGRARVLLR